MTKNVIFNATVCLIGIMILMIHVLNIIFKRGKRNDEKVLLTFFVFTIIHFSTYLAFTIIKTHYTSDAFITAFYTTFYIMNNIEALLLFRYVREYVCWEQKKRRVLSLFNLCIFTLFVILDVINIFTGIFFTAKGGAYVRSNTMILSQGYQFVIFLIVFIVIIADKKLNAREKTAFGLYCFLPLVAIILQNIFKGYAIAYVSIIIAIEMLFLFLSVQRNIALAQEEEKNKDAQIKLMLSQIKPHFVYNSLSSISTLISINPEKAQATLDAFTEYLRTNLSSLTEVRCISFEDELKHIKTYVSLEKMRFSDRINVSYDIQTTDFFVPPLTIQPIVENAIKHGILSKLEGGKLTFKTYETEKNYVVEVADDGIGFDINAVDFKENKHYGLKNIEYRLSKMCDAVLTVKSEINVGTTVTVAFKK
ncbi:MAG: histidine kinase [Clostridia bacterium]|nr:histidine kinase [Clostridia bacterium]